MSSQSTAATRDVEVRIEYLFPLMSLLGARQPPLLARTVAAAAATLPATVDLGLSLIHI